MRARITRQRLARVVAVAASLAMVVACGPKKDTPTPQSSPSATATSPAVTRYAKGAVLISNGTETVMIDGQPVTFPTTVTDATWSPDGSRIAFVDRESNISSSRPDGSHRLVLTEAKPGVRRSHPTWFGSELIFAEKGSGKAESLMSVLPGGHRPNGAEMETPARVYLDGDGNGSAPSASNVPGSLRVDTRLAFQHQAASGSEVWIADSNQRSPWSVKVANGSQPAMSPDGRTVAFVDSTGQIDTADVGKYPPAKPLKITTGLHSPQHLAWSADGARIAYQTGTGVDSVAAVAAPSANPPKQISATVGVPAFLTAELDHVVNVTGTGPVQTAIAGSRSRWLDQPIYQPTESGKKAEGATLAGVADSPSTLAGPVLAGSGARGPLLFTGAAALDTDTEAELKRVLGKVPAGLDGPTVTIMGGTNMVSTAAENRVKALGYRTERVAGPDSYAIAWAIAQRTKPAWAEVVFVVDAADLRLVAEAKAAGPYGSVVLPTKGSTLATEVRAYLNGLRKEAMVYTLGPAATSAFKAWGAKLGATVVSLDAPNRSEMTTLILGRFDGYAQRLVVADQSSPAELAIAVGLANAYGAALVPVDPKSDLDSAIRSWLEDSSGSLDTVMVVGSLSGSGVPKTIGDVVSGPQGFTTTTNPVFAG